MSGEFLRVTTPLRCTSSGSCGCAIATDQSRKIVFVVKDDDAVEARTVVLGPLDEGLRVIREGLKPEDRVIIDGIQRARVGAKVSPHAGKIVGDKS